MAIVKLMTQAEYAKHRGCSGVAVFKAVKAGRVSLIDRKIDPAVADIQWAANTRARASGGKTEQWQPLPLPGGQDTGAPPATDDGYMQSRARREAAEANMSEMKEADLRGKYLDKADVDAAVFEIARAMRDGLANCARRIAADVAALASAKECEVVIDREHRALLESMSHSLNARLGAGNVESGEGE